MSYNVDLFTIASSGVRAQSQLLQTTGQNIANVNTEGYSRQRTTFTASELGGVGRGTTERIINTFAQNQLRRDMSQVGEYETYHQKASQIDDIFANESAAISTALSKFFAAMQTSADEPTNMSARQLVIGQADSTLSRMQSMSDYLDTKNKELNLELESLTDRANHLIETIADLNGQIRTSQFTNRFDEPGEVKDERDRAILELAELVSIQTIDTGDGATLVNLTSGQSLVMENGTFNVFETNGDPDATHKNIQLFADTGSSGNTIEMDLAEGNLGGKIGGLFRYRDEILAPTQRELGQIALTFVDAMNEQNNLGMDFDGQLGGDIFSIKSFQGLNYNDNADASHNVNGRFTGGDLENLTTADYRVTIDATGAGTVDFTVTLLNPDGTQVLDTNGNPVEQSYTGETAAAGTFIPIIDGLEVEFPDGVAYTAGDAFLLQPTKMASSLIDVAITRPEDLALALPVRVEGSLNNLGDAQVVGTTVTNTTVDNAFGDTTASGFDGAGGIHSSGNGPGGTFGAPASVVFTGPDSYEIRDDAGLVITTVSGVTNFDNLIAQGVTSGAGPAWPAAFAAMDDYPGYDFSIQGVPQAGDTFTIGFNTNGVDDSRNGVLLADLQNTDTMRRDASTGYSATNAMTFHEAYARTVSDIGERTQSADIALQAAEAMKEQSQSWFDSVSGVNLDEEAANLLRFQQAYAASAKILNAAQTVFDTILSAVR